MYEILAHIPEKDQNQIAIAVMVLAVVALVILVAAIFLLILVVRWLLGGPKAENPTAAPGALLTCWHCGRETSAVRSDCEHCQKSLQ